MIAPKTITLTIDGQTVEAQPGQTVLQAAESIGVKIPSLCHHKHLSPIGACRLCLVEIEQQRTLQPSCTFPVADGLVVHTSTPKVLAARLMNLQLLFSERAHYCMFCPSSGNSEDSDCELQQLGYSCGISSWPYPPQTDRRWPLDASHPNITIDHSRCVVCRRCVRACSELVANHTLGVQQRGAKAMIGADDAVSLGDSSCISCGMCVQVCPTGAMTDRRSAYAGRDAQAEHVKSACLGCAVACGIEAAVRDNQLLRIDGDWNASSQGLLCEDGRYKSLDVSPDRIARPLIRREHELHPASWDEALAVIADRLRTARPAGIISPRRTTEAMAAFVYLFQEVLSSSEVALLYGHAPPLLGEPASLADVANADCLIVIGTDPLRHQKVVGYLAKRAFDLGANIIVVGDAHMQLDPYARHHLRLHELSAHADSPFARLHVTYHLRIDGLKQLRTAVDKANRPVVLYGNGLSTTVYAALRGLPDKVAFMPLVMGANTRGAAELGLGAREVEGEALYALIGDEAPISPPPPAGFRVVQASHHSSWTEEADVVLPARTWPELAGHLTDIEGSNRIVRRLLEPPAGVLSDADILLDLARRLGYSLNLEDIPGVPAAPAAAEEEPV